MIIGLSGYARSGKDEAARVLVNEFGFRRVAFADKLRDFLYALNPKLGEVDFGQGTAVKEYRVRDFIDEFGWDGYKEAGPYHAGLSRETRELLQRLGTEAGRETMWDSIWIDAALHNLGYNEDVVITDVRFPNEAHAVRERGGRLWRIHRDGVGPANDHPSETSLDTYYFDEHIGNDGSNLEKYRATIRLTAQSMGRRKKV